MSRSICFLLVAVFGMAFVGDNPKPDQKPFERVLRGDDSKLEMELEREIQRLTDADEYGEAITKSEELLALRTKVQGPDHWETINQKWNLAALRIVARLPAEKRAGWRKAVQGIAGSDQLIARGQYAPAEALWREYGRWCEEVHLEKHPNTAYYYNSLAFLLSHQGNYEEATKLCQQAIELRSELLGEDHPDTATSYHNLANNLLEQGRVQDAQDLFQKALHIRVEMFGEKHHEVAECYNGIAVALHAQGRSVDARLVMEKALELNRALFGEDHSETAGSLNNIGAILIELGRYSDAQSYFERALDTFRGLYGEKHPYTARGYDNLASILNAQGRYLDANALYRKALALNTELLGDKNPQTIMGYANLALNLHTLKNFEEAQAMHEKALEQMLAVLGNKHPYLARGYANLALSLSGQEKYEDAKPFYKKSVEMQRELLGEKHMETALSYAYLATNANTQGEYAEAEPLYRIALEIDREVLGQNHPTTVECYGQLASNLSAQGKSSEALVLLTKAASSYEAARMGVASRVLERAAFGARHSPYPLLAVVRARLSHGMEAWAAAEADLARGLSDEIASRRHATLATDEQEQRTAISERLDQLNPQILELALKASLTEAEKAALGQLHAKRGELEDDLAELAAKVSQREVASFAQIQSSIPRDAALVFWLDESAAGEEHWGCVVKRTGAPNWEPLAGTGPDKKWTKEDNTIPTKLRESLKSGASIDEINKLGKQLTEQRMAPLAAHLKNVKKLYVVPINDMAAIPIDLIAPDYTISYIPSGTLLAKLKDKAPSEATGLIALGDPVFKDSKVTPTEDDKLPAHGVLITQVIPSSTAANAGLQRGDVILQYGDTPLDSTEQLTSAVQAQAGAKEIAITVWRQGLAKPFTRSVPAGRLGVVLDKQPAPQAVVDRRKSDAMLESLRGDTWNELPGTRVEVTQLAKLFGPKSTVLFDSAASEQSLESLRRSGELAKFRYLHIASHGEANDLQSLESAVILAQDSLPADSLPKAGEPFVNGKISAAEVLEFWELNTELVTLSACETAIGRPGGGDGLLGFAQAFLAVGSRAVCLSLWKVDDTATALLMTRFYENLLGTRSGLDRPLPKAAALAEAKHWLRELSGDEVTRLTVEATKGLRRSDRGKGETLKLLTPPAPTESDASNSKPFSHPRFWSAFVLIGDPN